jgi:hypothetical protein
MMEQILERLLACQEQMTAKMKAQMESNQVEMMARLEAKIEDKMDPHHEKFEDLRGTLVSRMDIHQSRTESTQ